MNGKECRAYHETRPLAAFIKNPQCRDGYGYVCRTCREKRKLAAPAAKTPWVPRPYIIGGYELPIPKEERYRGPTGPSLRVVRTHGPYGDRRHE